MTVSYPVAHLIVDGRNFVSLTDLQALIGMYALELGAQHERCCQSRVGAILAALAQREEATAAHVAALGRPRPL